MRRVFLAILMFVLLISTSILSPQSGDFIFSKISVISPFIDGAISPDEWDDAALVDISNLDPSGMGNGGDPANICRLYVKNDRSFLYIAFDIVTDPDLDSPPQDMPWMSGERVDIWIDTDHNGIYPESPQNDLMYRLFSYLPEDFKPYQIGPSFQAMRQYMPAPGSLYGLAFLSAGEGKASSSAGNSQYELKIPLSELGVEFGTTVGIFLYTYNLESSLHMGLFPDDDFLWTYLFHPELWADLQIAVPSITQDMEVLAQQIQALPCEGIKEQNAKSLCNKINEIINKYKHGDLEGAFTKLLHDVRDKVEKWIKEEYQEGIIALIEEILKKLKAEIAK